jgi:hypothetical protein
VDARHKAGHDGDGSAMTDAKMISLAVWDVPMPVVARERFTLKAGATSAAGRNVEVCNASGKVVSSGTLGHEPLAGTDALYWTTLDLPSPPSNGVAEYTVRVAGTPNSSRFSVVAADRPKHTLAVMVTEQASKAALEGVEIRLGPFHARTDKGGRAELRVAKGEYQLQLWRTAHIAQPTPISIDGDTSIALTMLHVPEEHPDARWVR